MTKNDLANLMLYVFETEIMPTREAGQKEYAHKEDNAFDNFDRLAADLGLQPEQVLWVYAMKHRDGIASYINGHKSQREDVRGRINDLIVYLMLLRGMVERREEDAERITSGFAASA